MLPHLLFYSAPLNRINLHWEKSAPEASNGTGAQKLNFPEANLFQEKETRCAKALGLRAIMVRQFKSCLLHLEEGLQEVIELQEYHVHQRI